LREQRGLQVQQPVQQELLKQREQVQRPEQQQRELQLVQLLLSCRKRPEQQQRSGLP
jgi:hypothetical protein